MKDYTQEYIKLQREMIEMLLRTIEVKDDTIRMLSKEKI